MGVHSGAAQLEGGAVGLLWGSRLMIGVGEPDHGQAGREEGAMRLAASPTPDQASSLATVGMIASGC